MGPILLSVISGLATSAVQRLVSRPTTVRLGSLTSAAPRPSVSASRPSFPGGYPQSSEAKSSVQLAAGAQQQKSSKLGLLAMREQEGGMRPVSEKLALALRDLHLTSLSGPQSLANELSSPLANVVAPGGGSFGGSWSDESDQEDTDEGEETEDMGLYDEEVGADEIYINETAGDEDEVGARARARPKAKNANAPRRIAFITAVSIAAASTVAVPISLNKSFKGIGMRLNGTNQDKLLFNGAVIRGTPQEASSGSIGCSLFTLPGETFFWEWDTASPGESFTLSFTNTHTAAVTPTGYLIGYMSAT